MSQEPKFEVGDVVRLRVDGSPEMIVEGVEVDGRLLCVWTDGGGNRVRQAFPLRSLRAAGPVARAAADGEQ